MRTEGRGRTVDEWRPRPSGGDNHWLDCLVGAAVAASVQGCSLPETGAKPKVAQKLSMKFSEIQREKIAARERRREAW